MNFWTRAAAAGFVIPKLNEEILKRCFPGTRCRVLDGRAVSENLIEQCRILVKGRRTPKLSVVIVGDNAASHVYVKNKVTNFKKASFDSEVHSYATHDVDTQKLISVIKKLNEDASVDGILVQLPLPSHIDEKSVLSAIETKKDVDGFLPENLGKLAAGYADATLACTPFGVMVILATYGISLEGKNVAVVGRSNIVGKPMALLLSAANATVTLAHSRTRELSSHCKNADIIVAAVGSSGLIRKEFVRPDAILVDVGMNRNNEGKLVGDVDFSVTEVASALTPVPGGVGPMTIAMLCINTALAAWR